MPIRSVWLREVGMSCPGHRAQIVKRKKSEKKEEKRREMIKRKKKK